MIQYDDDHVKIVVQRWRTARDAYRRDRNKVYKTKSGQAAKGIKKYVYFENLRFLDSVLDINNTETSLHNSIEDDEIRTTHDNSDLSEDEPHTQENIVEEPDANAPETRKRFERKKRRQDDILGEKMISLLEKSNEKATEEEDADRSFLISLLPTLKGFDEDKKLQFRAKCFV
ncbi:uncharacterized protein LOC116180710 [Photinus pyralis]|uniref:uncharacterized protein LOC116180710 n=1 Tax=Photinus pyralis TaxID=7054 RepID=UPI0012676433|nr:uncharacterized protein LOC116180710 [Photinus pyralis]